MRRTIRLAVILVTALVLLTAPAAAAARMRLVKDIVPGERGANVVRLSSVGGILFFRANTPRFGEELWRSDGTEAGTVMVRDIRPGPADSFPNILTEVGGTLYFEA